MSEPRSSESADVAGAPPPAGGGLEERRLRELLEVGRALVSELDLDALLRRVLDAAHGLTGARYAALGVLDASRTELDRFVTVGIDEQTHRAIGDLPRGRGVLGELIRNPRPLRLHDVGEHPRSYGFPPAHPPMHTFLGVPVLIRGEAWGNLYLTEKEGGGDFDEADEEAAVILAAWVAQAVENARLYAGLESRREELERTVRGLEATTSIARAVGGETDLDRVLELIVKRGRDLVEARSLVIMLERAGRLVVAATAGELGPNALGSAMPVDGSLPGEVFRTGRPERVSAVPAELPAEVAWLAGAGGTALMVPVSFRGRTQGVLVAFDRLSGEPEFGPEDERLLLSFAASAATAVATARSVEAVRLRQSIEAAEQERRRWARELHDQTLQALGGLRVLLSTPLRQGDTEQLERAARTAVEEIDREIESLQAIITELRPAALDEIGLEAALANLARRSEAVEGVDVELDVRLGRGNASDAPLRLAPELESAIYRLVQEALTNAAKHAEASRAQVRVSEHNGRVEVEVADDGRGFNPAAVSRGFGLVGMRERVELLDGTLAVSSSPGAGTTVSAVLPLASAGSGAAAGT